MKVTYFLVFSITVLCIAFGFLIGTETDAVILKKDCSTTGVSHISKTRIICAVTN